MLGHGCSMMSGHALLLLSCSAYDKNGGTPAFRRICRHDYFYFNLKMLSELAGISTSAPFLLVVMKLSTG